ncbi:SprT family zinc-dependent metalloprotease [Marivita sp.]|jgi:predicted metal-dependent hydrolase|uniref:M48 family metallopeptidase n=1 Tax=Marivita sp. TaxID=2003365 RepID=UPI00321A8691
MSVRTFPGNPEIPLKLRKNARARRMTLRISRVDGAVTLTVPRGVSEREALEFAAEKRDWVIGNLSQHDKPQLVGPGDSIDVGGRSFQIVQGDAKRLSVQDGRIILPAPIEKGRVHLMAWLKERARIELTRASDHYAERLGRGYSRITLRDTRSRWGSCSSAGALMYSWRLILAPKNVLDYVAAHEVAHLQEMNHSADFWRVVDRLYGPHQEARTWLRHEGPKLHRFRFDT